MSAKQDTRGAVDVARDVVATRQHQRGLDLTTAQAIVAVADKLSAENVERLNARSIPDAAALAWKLVK